MIHYDAPLGPPWSSSEYLTHMLTSECLALMPFPRNETVFNTAKLHCNCLCSRQGWWRVLSASSSTRLCHWSLEAESQRQCTSGAHILPPNKWSFLPYTTTTSNFSLFFFSLVYNCITAIPNGGETHQLLGTCTRWCTCICSYARLTHFLHVHVGFTGCAECYKRVSPKLQKTAVVWLICHESGCISAGLCGIGCDQRWCGELMATPIGMTWQWNFSPFILSHS